MQWIKHQSSLLFSPEAESLIEAGGYEAYGLLWRVVELTATREHSSTFSINFLRKVLGISVKRLIIFLKLFQKFNFLNYDTDGETVSISFGNLLKQQDNQELEQDLHACAPAPASILQCNKNKTKREIKIKKENKQKKESNVAFASCDDDSGSALSRDSSLDPAVVKDPTPDPAPNPRTRRDVDLFAECPEIPGSLRDALTAFAEHRQRLRKPMTPHGMALAVQKLSRWHPDNLAEQVAAVEASIVNGWQGLFPFKHDDDGAKHQTSCGESLFERNKRAAQEAAERFEAGDSFWDIFNGMTSRTPEPHQDASPVSGERRAQ